MTRATLETHLGGLALGIVEVSGYSDHGVADLLAEESLRNLLHLDKDHGADFFGGEGLLGALHVHLFVPVTPRTDGNQGTRKSSSAFECG